METTLKQVVEKEHIFCKAFKEIADNFSDTFSSQNRQKNSAAIILELEQKNKKIQQNIDGIEKVLKDTPKALEEFDTKISELNTKKKHVNERINQLTHDIDKAEKENMQHRDFHLRAMQRLASMNFDDAEKAVKKYLVLDTTIDSALESKIEELNTFIKVYYNHASKCLLKAKTFAGDVAQKSQDNFACFYWGNVFKTLFHDPSTANDGLLRQHSIYKFIEEKTDVDMPFDDDLEKIGGMWDKINGSFAELKKMRDEILEQYEESSKIIMTHLPLMNKFKESTSQLEEAQEELTRYNSFVIEACGIVNGIHGCEDPLNSGNEESKMRFLSNRVLFDHVVECVNEADSISQEIIKVGEMKVQKQRDADTLREKKEKFTQNYAHLNELLIKQKNSGSNSSLVIQTQAEILITDSLKLIDDVEDTINGVVSITQDIARLRSVRRVAINTVELIVTLRQNVDTIYKMIENSEDIDYQIVDAVISGFNELCKELMHLSKICSQKLEFIFGTTSRDTLKNLPYEEDSDNSSDDDEDNDDDDDYSEEEDEDEEDKVEIAENDDKARKKSAHAINVLNRVKEKLEGKDTNIISVPSPSPSPSPFSSASTSASVSSNNRMSVVEQVNSVISLARSPENLSKMFEGWTAWI